MPTQKIVTLYTYDELPTEAAKVKARDWFREGDRFEGMESWDDFIAICEAMGVDIGHETSKGWQGRETTSPMIRYTGFWSQGDGASFAGTFKATGKAGASIRAYAPQDDELHRIADAIDAIAANYPNGLTADITFSQSRYCHENTMQIDALAIDMHDDEISIPDAEDKELTELFRSLARWLYRYLESEYNERNSDESVEGDILANEYTFTEDGKRED